MITPTITNEMLRRIVSIENCRTRFPGSKIPGPIHARLRKNSKKRSTHASTSIEGNPLTAEQASAAIDSTKRHFLKPEEEVRNYYAALELLDEKLARSAPFSKDLVLEVQRLIVKGESAEKTGFRGPMPPGVLFAVYDSGTGVAEYIPPEAGEVESLLDELVEYVEASDDHPLIKAGIVHYQLVTIHPFEDGNGRTARLMSGYCLNLDGFGFGGIGSLEEYFAYNPTEYYDALQMGLPPLYYDGRDNPPHPEIWMEYFLRMVELYAQKATEIAGSAASANLHASLSHLGESERAFFEQLIEEEISEFRPIDMAKRFGVSNRTVINWCAKLAAVGLLEPRIVRERTTSYAVTVPPNPPQSENAADDT